MNEKRLELESLKQSAESMNKPGGENMCGRQSARHMLEDKISFMRREIVRLEKLLEALPAKLPIEADEALWRILCSAKF